MKSKKYATVDEYWESIPDHALGRMTVLRAAIKVVAPLAEEVISYNMPALKYKRILVYYAAYANHIGFYALPTTHELFAGELSEYKIGKGSVQFPYDKPFPIDLIKRMAKYRYEENL